MAQPNDMDDGSHTITRVATDPTRKGSGAADTDKERVQRSVVLLAFALEFGPFVIAAVLLLLASLATDIPELAKVFPNSHVGIYVCLIFVALLGFIVRLTRQQAKVDLTVMEMVTATRDAIDHVRPDIETVSLSEAFQGDGMRGTSSGRVRIFAITSRYITQQLRTEDFRAEHVDLMVAGNGESDPSVPAAKMLATEVELAIEYSWASRVRNGYIDTLCVHQYQFFPTEWYAIFDERLMVLGSYAFDLDSVGCAEPLHTVMLVHPAGAGRELIRTKVAAFDHLMQTSSQRVGSGSFEGEYKLREDKVARRGPGSEDWVELPNISQTTPA